MFTQAACQAEKVWRWVSGLGSLTLESWGSAFLHGLAGHFTSFYFSFLIQTFASLPDSGSAVQGMTGRDFCSWLCFFLGASSQTVALDALPGQIWGWEAEGQA